MLLIPRATEKTYQLSTQSVYAFFVPKTASKQAIASAVADQFGVTVLKVKTNIRNGKSMRFSRGRHAYPGITHRQDRKVAYVTLKSGDKIPVFDTKQDTSNATTIDKSTKDDIKVDKKAQVDNSEKSVKKVDKTTENVKTPPKSTVTDKKGEK